MRSVYKWRQVDGIIVAYATAGAVDEQVWKGLVQGLSSASAKKFLSASIGHVEVSSLQRKVAVDVLRSRKIPTAAVSDERLVRGMITAASWLGANIKAFSWTEMGEALEFLGATSGTCERVMVALKEMRVSAAREM